jgi:hypothetical protein
MKPLFCVVLACLVASLTLWSQSGFRPEIPKVWDEVFLADWVTPIARLNVRPKHMSAKEYYSMPEYNFRSYPAYMPGREPEGYWQMLQHIGPQPLIEPETLKTEADWIAAGTPDFRRGRYTAIHDLGSQGDRPVPKPRVPGTAECQISAGRYGGLPVGADETGSGTFKRRELRWVSYSEDGERRTDRRCIRTRRNVPHACPKFGCTEHDHRSGLL